MAEMDLHMMISNVPSLIEQLGKALNDLESQENSSIDKGLIRDILGHFRNLEAAVVNKSLELEIREKAFKEQESDAHLLIVSREADIAAKEHKLWDQLQELKDAAVSAIVAARGDHQVESLEHTDAEDSKDIEVSSSLGITNAHHIGSEVKSSGSAADGASGKVEPRPELTQLCEQMDAKGLLHYIIERKKKMTSISEELSVALDGATEPGRLVLASLEFFYSNDESNSQDEKGKKAIHSLRQACLVCMEAIASLLAKAKPGADHLLYPEIKQQAMAIADEWKPKLATAGTDAANQASLETEAFLQLLTTFRIASEFDEEELCKLVLAVAHNRQGPELCRSLGLEHKMPGVIEALIHSERQIDAARFIHSFELSETFPLVPLLKGYLKDLRRNAQGKGGNSGNAEELAAVKAIVQCIRDYKLEAEYPLDPLLRRVAQLEKAISNDKDRSNDKKRLSGLGKHQQFKRPRVTGGTHGSIRHPNVLSIQPQSVLIERAAANNPSRLVPSVLVERAAPAGLLDKYAFLSTSYDYQPPSQATYPQQTYEQRSYYYPADEGIATSSYSAAPLSSSYASYSGGVLPTAAERINASSYGNYAGSGTPTAYQPYM
ncbi:FRIGIDA-like protein 3 [Solanum lycopersicum]|uniref:FRIGIDA-like protein n=1 Tax=Solanum lycopersicum TaxID=4081 RepID=A0A3Q7FWB4_SOLLC|nr:FRIGIDA-like protein 3 [Solanum lycopersicum]